MKIKKFKIICLIVFGYGLGIEYAKSSDYINDGSIKKYDFEFYKSKYSDTFLVISWMYDYTILFKIYLNKDD